VCCTAEHGKSDHLQIWKGQACEKAAERELTAKEIMLVCSQHEPKDQ